MEPSKGFVDSKDGTRIAYTRYGTTCPAVVLVDGALAAQEFGPNKSLAEALSSRYTVYTYDRRGRGGSGDTLPREVEREFEDLDAVIALAVEPVMLYGISSGGGLVLDYLRSGRTARKVALYEVPLVVDDTRPPTPDDFVEQTNSILAQAKNGSAVKYFMRTGVDLPALMVAAFPLFPGWSHLKAVAPTLAYDLQYVGAFQHGRPLPADRWSGLTMPVTLIAGGKSPEWMRRGNSALAEVIPGATHRVLPGQTHLVKAAALAPVLVEFFG
ncbi:alpha/beta hydrolase [Nocardia yunnanensis]|uniref:Alpha/beta hydrolase n=1 Tax=Nocardia yunnanensis TaxID=2382165 RepID=A0A386Z5K3_9NOCA|nr:alpha/beta hydrolase [Nocardia yunnanensis]AYF72941.1 alpha/beta hydrolase [Nocardia yunnanensis]